MRRAAVASVALLATVTLLTGCQKEEAEKLVAPLVADAQETPEAKKAEEKKSPLIPEIDDNLSIEEGARIAVVSKCKKGEFWDKVKEGMEAAVKDVNEAYGFKKDKQITMTFEGPDNEEDVESQINTLDAVIAENPSVVCLSAGDMDSCQAQLEAAKENGIPVIAFDSNVSDTKLVRAFRGTDNTQIGKYAAYKLGSAIGKMGNVAIFSAQEKTQSSQERVKGFLDNIANYTDIKVVETVYSDQVDDMKEAIDRAARKEIKPAVMITHVGGIDSIVDTTKNLPDIPGGKKLTYLHINMPMTAISDLRSLAKDDPFFNDLADICDKHNGLWSAEAEKALLTHYGVE